MRVVMAASLVLAFAAGSAFGVDYTFTGTKFDELSSKYANWDNADNWTPVLVNHGNTGDSFTMALDSNTKQVLMPNQQALPGNTKYFGSITVTGGALVYQGSTNPSVNIWRLQADNGQNGSFSISGANSKIMDSSWNQRLTIDLDGNMNFQPGTWGSMGEGFYVRMRGLPTGVNDRTFTFAGSNRTGTRWAHYLQVDNGVHDLAFVAPTTGYNAARQVILNNTGAASGLIYTMHQANNYAIYVAPGTDVTQLDVHVLSSNSSGAAGGHSWVSGKHYRDFVLSAEDDYFLANATRTTHIAGGDMHVRNFTFDAASANVNSGGTQVFDTDNGGITRNLTVDGAMKIGPSRADQQRDVFTILKLNSSTVTIGLDLSFTRTNRANLIHGAYLTAGNAQVHIGRNFTVDNGSASIRDGWNAGTSTFYFDNAVGGAQRITSGTGQVAGAASVPFYNVVINNPGGTVTLADNLVLKGSLDIAAGTLATNGKYVVFHGGFDNIDAAQQITIGTGAALSRVHIASGSDTFVKLMSDLTITDNLDIDAGCKLFLNGFNLYAAASDLGQDFVGFTGTFTTTEGGEIIGAAAVPEPATLLLLGTGALGALGYIRRKRMA